MNEPKPQLPSVGRAVHYTSYGTADGKYPQACRAATITEVDQPGNVDSAVGLCIMNPTGLFFTQHVEFGTEPGQWHWPERV